jgi:regulator of sirC expression with transglutaminase-like and TPR domain
VTQPLLQKTIAAYNASLKSYQSAEKYAPPSTRADMLLAVSSAAQLAGNTKVALATLKRYVKLVPNSPDMSTIEAQCKRLGGSCAPAHQK